MSYPIVAVQTSETFIIPSMEESVYDVADWIERYIDDSVATAAENRNVQSIEAEINRQLFSMSPSNIRNPRTKTPWATTKWK